MMDNCIRCGETLLVIGKDYVKSWGMVSHGGRFGPGCHPCFERDQQEFIEKHRPKEPQNV